MDHHKEAEESLDDLEEETDLADEEVQEEEEEVLEARDEEDLEDQVLEQDRKWLLSHIQPSKESLSCTPRTTMP